MAPAPVAPAPWLPRRWPLRRWLPRRGPAPCPRLRWHPPPVPTIAVRSASRRLREDHAPRSRRSTSYPPRPRIHAARHTRSAVPLRLPHNWGRGASGGGSPLHAPDAGVQEVAADLAAVQPLIRQADQAVARGDMVDAYALYRQAINAAPLSDVPRLKLAQAYALGGLPDKALSEAQRALEIAPDSLAVQEFLIKYRRRERHHRRDGRPLQGARHQEPGGRRRPIWTSAMPSGTARPTRTPRPNTRARATSRPPAPTPSGSPSPTWPAFTPPRAATTTAWPR